MVYSVMSKNDVLKVLGKIERVERTHYVVVLDIPAKPTIKAYLSGKMRSRHIDIVMGDMVQVEVDKAHPELGRIVYRENKKIATNDMSQIKHTT